MDEREQQLLRAIRHLRRIALLATLLGGAVAAIGVFMFVARVARGPAGNVIAPLPLIPIGIAFAIGGRMAARSFQRTTVRMFQPRHGSSFSDELRWELESLKVQVDKLEPPLAPTASTIQCEPRRPPQVVDSCMFDGAIKVAFHWGEQLFHVLFGDATARDTDDVNEPWRVQLGIRRCNETEVDLGMLDDLIQCSPYLRFRFGDGGDLRESDEWFGGDPCTIAGKPGEMDLAVYFGERPQTMELLWVDGVEQSLGKLPVREVES